MKLSDRARKNGIDCKTACRLFRSGKFPRPTEQLPTGTILVHEPEPGPVPEERVVLYARVSSADQKSDLDRQMKRLEECIEYGGSVVSARKIQGLGIYRYRRSCTLSID